MAKNVLYTNGVIAVREKYLLKDKILKLCETSAEDALRSLVECGFGRGAEVVSVYEYEKLISADEAAIDEFIREYAPSDTELKFLLSPRDFHNAKALAKAIYLNLDGEKMLAPEGLVPVSVLADCIREKNYDRLNSSLQAALAQIEELFAEENASPSGAEIGLIFEKAMFAHLAKVCCLHPLLRKLVAAKADMTNILTALRSSEFDYAKKCFVPGGKLKAEQLAKLFDEDKEVAEHALDGTPYGTFYKKCLADRGMGLPLTQAEKVCESYETDYFAARKYELNRNQPFLYYVFRRRAENTNVRILFVCLLAGMREQDIKKRLRTF